MPDKSRFKGIRIRDDGQWGSLGMEAEYYMDMQISHEEFRQELSDSCRVDQASEIFEALTKPSQQESEEVRGQVRPPGLIPQTAS